jgi:tRNA threonylcarbamoyladenosine biosynthesis protein TsaB
VLVLAVDTTTERASVAVVQAGAVRGEVRLRASDGHSRRLLPAVSFLLDSLGLEPRAVEGYAVTLGPGSFTGLRVGLSTVQGLALAARRPCLGRSALDVLAARAAGSAPVVAAVMDAYRGEVFAAARDAAGTSLVEGAAWAPEAFLAALPPGGLALIGDGALRYRERVLAVRPDARFPDRSLFLAATLGLLAEPELEAGRGARPEDLRPLYLREADIRKPSA